MATDRDQNRRAKEQGAPRLANTAPTLRTLAIEVEERSQIARTKYKKHFLVGSAPAYFMLSCNDERCEHGGYDITREVMQALRAHETRSRGDVTCDGMTGTAFCGRSIHYELFADYQPVAV